MRKGETYSITNTLKIKNFKRNISDRQNFLVLNLVVLIIWHYKQFYESDEVTFKLVFQTYTITGH